MCGSGDAGGVVWCGVVDCGGGIQYSVVVWWWCCCGGGGEGYSVVVMTYT